jgi:hypothetical protein
LGSYSNTADTPRYGSLRESPEYGAIMRELGYDSKPAKAYQKSITEVNMMDHYFDPGVLGFTFLDDVFFVRRNMPYGWDKDFVRAHEIQHNLHKTEAHSIPRAKHEMLTDMRAQSGMPNYVQVFSLN